MLYHHCKTFARILKDAKFVISVCLQESYHSLLQHGIKIRVVIQKNTDDCGLILSFFRCVEDCSTFNRFYVG